MACVVELEGHLVVVVAQFAREISAFADAATHPGLLAEIYTTMGVEGILHELQFLALARHDIHGIVEHDVGDGGGALGHENRALRLPAGQNG